MTQAQTKVSFFYLNPLLKVEFRAIFEPFSYILLNEGLPGVLGNKGTWPFTFREQEIFLNNFYGTRELLRYIREQGNIDFFAISDFWTDFL